MTSSPGSLAITESPVSLISDQRRRQLAAAATAAAAASSSSPSPTHPSPPMSSSSPKPVGLGSSGLPAPVPLSSSSPPSKPCCQTAINAGQPFCPTCYVTSILSSYKNQQQPERPQQEKPKPNENNPNNASSSASSSSSATPVRPVSPGRVPAPSSEGPLAATEILSLLQQGPQRFCETLKQRLANGGDNSNALLGQQQAPQNPFLAAAAAAAAELGSNRSPLADHQMMAAASTPQELLIQSLLASQHAQNGAHILPPPHMENLQFLANRPPGHPLIPPPPGPPPGPPSFVGPFVNPAEAAAQMNPYSPYGASFDINGMRRKNATRETTAVLKQWLAGHRKNPYPTKGEKIMLAIISKMTLTQVSTWFANARRRLKKENKGNHTWNSSGGGDAGDPHGSHSNDGDLDGDDDVDVELQGDSGDDYELPIIDDDDDDDVEPPQRRPRFDNVSSSPISINDRPPNISDQAFASSLMPKMTTSTPQQHDNGENNGNQQPQAPNQFAASIAALLESAAQQQQQQQQQQQPQMPPHMNNPIANLIQQVYGDRLSAALQLQQQLGGNVGNPLVSNPQQLLLSHLQQLQQQQQQQQQPNKDSGKKGGGIWSIAAEIASTAGQHQA